MSHSWTHLTLFNNVFKISSKNLLNALLWILHQIFDFHIYFSNIILNRQHIHTVLSKNIFQKSRFCQNIAICYNNECSIKYKKSSRILFIETILINIRFVCTHINCCYSTQHFVKINTINTTLLQILNFIKMYAKHFLTISRLFFYL